MRHKVGVGECECNFARGKMMERQTVALLFSDVAGYSQLKEPQLRIFLEKIFPEIARLLEQQSDSFIEKNTWGDGIIIASADPYQLANFALALRDFFRNRNWSNDLLPELSSRIALHVGVVFTGQDPIRKTQGIIGTQVNLAARIEPVTTPGQVWVTQAFKNMIYPTTDPTLAFDELGERPLAKAFGNQLLYRLRRRHENESIPPAVQELDTRQPASKDDKADSPVVPSKFGIPKPGKLGILIDRSHQQHKWKQDAINSIFDLPLGKSNLISLVIPPSENVPWDIREIKDISHFQVGDLGNWRSLIFGLPYHQLISHEVCSAIAEWVIQGGRLILLGYECGERHHRTNLNILSDRFFGVRFNSDIVAPESWQSSDRKAYGEEIIFNDIPEHQIFAGVRTLCMRNLCTFTVEPGSSIILSVGKNKVTREASPKYTDGWTSAGTQHFEAIAGTNWFPIIAEAAQGLCGKGKVIAIGTWDFFGVDQCFKNNDNYTFARNLLRWSVEWS
jgi:class 3 adenylate cyclase